MPLLVCGYGLGVPIVGPTLRWLFVMTGEADLLLAVVVEMRQGAVVDGQGYEDAVLSLLARHGGSLERRLRSTDGVTEVQIIRFVSPAGLDAFMADPDRAALRAAVGDGAPVARVVEVRDVMTTG
jgi:hypothetical protein